MCSWLITKYSCKIRSFLALSLVRATKVQAIYASPSPTSIGTRQPDIIEAALLVTRKKLEAKPHQHLQFAYEEGTTIH